MELQDKLRAAFEKLCKWRSVFAGWQLGTRAIGDPESDAVRDHREVTILLRAEVTALTKIILDKKLCSLEQLQQAMLEEAIQLDKDYERRFPGISATEFGTRFTKEAAETMKNWKK